MAPLLRLLLVCALSTAVLASPHASRNVYAHAHRAIVPHQPLDVRGDSPPLPLQRRKRSLNRRCIPRPANATTPASPSTPINVAPLPSSSSSASTHSDYTPSSAPSPSSPPPSNPPPSSPPPSSPTPTPSPSPTTSSAAPAQTPSSSGSNSGEPSYLIGTQSGQGTWYGTGLGACGITNSDTDSIAAVSHLLFDSFPEYNGVNPNTNPVCGRQAIASYGGKSVTVTITDRCTACKVTDLDFSPTAFGQLADLSKGRIDITWVWKTT